MLHDLKRLTKLSWVIFHQVGRKIHTRRVRPRVIQPLISLLA